MKLLSGWAFEAPSHMRLAGWGFEATSHMRSPGWAAEAFALPSASGCVVAAAATPALNPRPKAAPIRTVEIIVLPRMRVSISLSSSMSITVRYAVGVALGSRWDPLGSRWGLSVTSLSARNTAGIAPGHEARGAETFGPLCQGHHESCIQVAGETRTDAGQR